MYFYSWCQIFKDIIYFKDFSSFFLAITIETVFLIVCYASKKLHIWFCVPIWKLRFVEEGKIIFLFWRLDFVSHKCIKNKSNLSWSQNLYINIWLTYFLYVGQKYIFTFTSADHYDIWEIMCLSIWLRAIKFLPTKLKIETLE